MSITPADAHQALKIMSAGRPSLRNEDPNVWAMTLSAAVEYDGTGNPRTRAGRPVLLNATSTEVLAAATRIGSRPGLPFPTPGDLAREVQDGRSGNHDRRRALIAADTAAHGAWIPEGLGSDPATENAARRAYMAAIGAGRPRDEAIRHAYRAVGATRPQVTGRDRSSDVRRLLAG